MPQFDELKTKINQHVPQVIQQPPEQEKDATDEAAKHSTAENNKRRENEQIKNDIPQNTQNQYGAETELGVNRDNGQSKLTEEHHAQSPPIVQQQSSCCIII